MGASVDLRQFFAKAAKADFADAVGVAIADDVISVAHVRKRLRTVTVPALASQPLDVPREGRTALVVDFVRDFVDQHGLEEARLSLALEHASVLIGHIQLPATATENIEAVIGYELDRILPVPADSVLTDQYWRPLGLAGERIHVTIVGAIRERIDEVQRELAAVGLAPSALTALPIALSDYYYYCRQADGRTAGLFYRDGDRECMTVTSRGLMISSLHFDPARETRSERMWREIESTVPDAMQDEVEEVVDDAGPDRGFAAIAPVGLLSDAGAPMRELRWHEAAAVGTALGQLGEAKVRVNLLPADLVRAEEGIGLRELGLSALVVVLALALGATIALKNLSTSNALASEVDSLLPRVTDVTRKEEENKRLMSHVRLLERHQRTSVLAYLKAMTAAVPNNAYLTTFRYKGDRLEVDGIATNASELIALLERSPYFKNVEFTAPTTKYLQNQERFSLRMGLEQ